MPKAKSGFRQCCGAMSARDRFALDIALQAEIEIRATGDLDLPSPSPSKLTRCLQRRCADIPGHEVYASVAREARGDDLAVR